MREFPESDWKLYRKHIAAWQENYMDKLNQEYIEILNQDKTIYEIVENDNQDNPKIENLLPATEEPTLPNINVEEKTEAAVAHSENIIKEAEKIIAQEEQKNTVASAPVEVKKEVKVEIIETTQNNTLPQAENTQPQTENVVKEVVKEVTIKEEVKAEVKEVEKPKTETVTASGKWQIQLISSPNKSAMDKSWVDLTKKYSQLKDLPHEIESADLGAKGTFYRLKAGAFSTRTDADKLCNSIKSAGGSCLVKKKQ